MKRLLTLLFMVASIGFLAAQDQEADLYEMSLEDLMDIDIYSVSKKAESLFEAPLSSSTLTRAEIENSGATSIPEALRLVPGLIVREISNGVYDVHLRGFDNLLRYSDGTDASNQITLVMIDGRPVFNNNLGGVYWEAIPVDLIDVERIEVVRGPSAPLYGPNAVEGVINIITSRQLEDGINIRGNFNTGTDNTQIAGLSLGYKFNDKLSATVSGNLQIRDRQETQYFNYFTDTYVENPEDLIRTTFAGPDTLGALAAKKLPNQEQALDKKGINLFLDYKVAEDFTINLQAGAQDSEVQKIYQENDFTPYSTSLSDSRYASVTINKSGLTGRFSYINGFDNLTTFNDQALLEYDYETIDAFVEYNWEVNNKLSLRPGLNYQRATYTDEPYINIPEFVFGVLNNEKTIRTFAASLSANYQISDNWRAIGGVRFDRFSQPEDVYVSYQFATTYNINENNLIRGVVARSNSGSFIGPNFLDVDISFPSPFGEGTLLFQGNEDLELFSVNMIELGYRTKLTSNLELNFELFRQVGENARALIAEVPETAANPLSGAASFRQIDLKAIQNGVTFSANYVANSSLQIKPFITWQSTEVENLPTGLYTADRNPANNIDNVEDVDNDQTPTLFGGAYINYQPVNKLNINLNPYYTSAQTQYSFYSLDNPATEAGDIDNKFILNAKVSYDITNNFNLYVNGRNIFDNDSREYFGADRNGSLYLVGLNVKF
ncbi:MAG: TonB-dependent receptor [Bacteroidota bacterium]